ncbi:MAG: hypothetical protein HRU72_07670 [Planctomycetia bacterium]|nr:hypothetical protein [Candidatus Brocadia sp.]QOJ06429.1 MAG: hypothetical protein HRU72_07670 [Planctomycetia bacterium]HQU32555.1 hypothetical protein [Candidatus Brocadia sapporoensis]
MIVFVQTLRFLSKDAVKLMESISIVRSRVWKEGREERFEEILSVVDWTIAGIYGECEDRITLCPRLQGGTDKLCLSV